MLKLPPSLAETSESSLEAWKIAAIFAAVFLVLETTAVLIYFVRCRDKNRWMTVKM